MSIRASTDDYAFVNRASRPHASCKHKFKENDTLLVAPIRLPPTVSPLPTYILAKAAWTKAMVAEL